MSVRSGISLKVDSNCCWPCWNCSLELNERTGARGLSVVAEPVVGDFLLELASVEEFLRFLFLGALAAPWGGLGERL